jgi:prepilin-type N-terminal cleavage/methylation domain-containing protein
MRSRLWGQRGFGLTELIVVLGLIALLAIVSVPNLLRYWQTSTLGAAADEFAGVLSRARALAVTQNNTVCVQVTGTSVRLLTGGCAGTVWTGTGTNAAGVITLANSMQISGGPTVVFTGTGGATALANFTVTNPKNGNTRGVAVATTGRVTIQ